MTTRELIEQLSTLDPDLPVYLCSDNGVDSQLVVPIETVGEERIDDGDDLGTRIVEDPPPEVDLRKVAVLFA